VCLRSGGGGRVRFVGFVGFVRLLPPHGCADHPSVPLVSFRLFPDARRLAIAHEVIHHQDVHLLFFFSVKRKQPWRQTRQPQGTSRQSTCHVKVITKARQKKSQDKTTQDKTTQHNARQDNTTQGNKIQHRETQDSTR
jgi:hypothetical protein